MFEFEKIRNGPERYDRNVQNTFKAIKKIEEIRVSREGNYGGTSLSHSLQLSL